MFSEIFERVHSKKPLVHHITNWVTIYDCADITCACGALPVMAHAREESGQMSAIADALVLNIGTLTPSLVESMIVAGESANEKGIPVLLDAVGVGATELRNEKAFELLEKIKVDIVKGNASEIAKLSGEDVLTRGVESTVVKADLISISKKLAKKYKNTTVITGKEDIVTDGNKVYIVKNGHEMMSCIVGTGCMAASVIGAFAGVERDYGLAGASALVCFGIAGELAAPQSKGPGTFKEHFFDEMYSLNREKIDRMMKVEER